MSLTASEFASLDSYSLAYHSLAAWKRILKDEHLNLPPDVLDKIEEELIPALEYVEGWDPTDLQVAYYSCGVAWHDGCF